MEHVASSVGGYDDLFHHNEGQANHYTALCLRLAAIVAAVIWMLNVAGFFIVDRTMMNMIMPLSIVMFLIPTVLERAGMNARKETKYLMIGCFALGIAMLSAVLTMHTVLAWSCPIILSCHYYSPRVTRFTTFSVLALMLVTFYLGLPVGVWDSNVMRANEDPGSAVLRLEYIRQHMSTGDNIYVRGFNFYYLPRAMILVLVHLISMTLSRRTHALISMQDRLVRDTERIRAELDIATEIQTSVLPSTFPAFPDRDEFDIFASMTPAKEVGGDFYDFFMVDEGHLAIVMADVSGKGVPAALFMMIGKTLIKNHTVPGRTPGDVFTIVNRLLAESDKEGFFITAFEGVLDLSSGELLYANAGHEPPFISRSGSPFAAEPIAPGFVLAGLEDTVYKTGRIMLTPGDRLFLYTDGVSEAVRTDGSLFGRERIGSALSSCGPASPEDMIKAMSGTLSTFMAGCDQADDITMLCLEYRAENQDR